MIFVIDSDPIMASCIARATKLPCQIFSNALDALANLSALPSLIFLDPLLDGPDGFSLLAELASYPDTAKIPIVLVSSLDFENQDLSAYHIVATLNKDTMLPADLRHLAQKYAAPTTAAHSHSTQNLTTKA